MGNEFLLPNELGWKCNDEISSYIDRWARNLMSYGDPHHNAIVWPVAKAELTDNIYAIIKRHQTHPNKSPKGKK